jgi:UDPglucose 6-dehydrogenase
MREAPSRVIVGELARRGAAIAAYDPVAMPEARRALAGVPQLDYVESPAAALDGADALVIVTEWKEFKSPDYDAIKSRLKQPVIFDGRNLYEPQLMNTLAIEYHGIGRGSVLAAS